MFCRGTAGGHATGGGANGGGPTGGGYAGRVYFWGAWGALGSAGVVSGSSSSPLLLLLVRVIVTGIFAGSCPYSLARVLSIPSRCITYLSWAAKNPVHVFRGSKSGKWASMWVGNSIWYSMASWSYNSVDSCLNLGHDMGPAEAITGMKCCVIFLSQGGTM